jgi:protein SCO1/2
MNSISSDAISTRPGAVCLTLAFVLLLACGVQPASARLGADYYPNVPLVNQDGEVLYFYDDVIKNKVVTINFMFTSCGDSCPLETAKLREVQTMLGAHAGRDVHMYSITVDPDRDTPAALKAYMKKFNVGPGWQFLTGKKSDIDLIRKKLAMYSEDETELSDHAINFVLGNADTGRWLKRTPFDNPQALVAVLLGRMQTRPLAIAAAKPDYAETGRFRQARTGEDLFTTRCVTCHSVGQGDRVGPDLMGVVSSRDRAWLERWLKEPDVMLKEKDPLATALYKQYGEVPMPNLQLTDENVRDLIIFMESESQRVSAGSNGKAADAR